MVPEKWSFMLQPDSDMQPDSVARGVHVLMSLAAQNSSLPPPLSIDPPMAEDTEKKLMLIPLMTSILFGAFVLGTAHLLRRAGIGDGGGLLRNALRACVFNPSKQTKMARNKSLGEKLGERTSVEDVSGVSIWREARDLVACCVSGVIFFCVYAFLQERLMSMPYGAKNEAFLYPTLATLVNRIVTLILTVPLVMAIERRPLNSDIPLSEFVVGAWANTIASNLQYGSLLFIDYPLLIISKACKIPPVMLLNIIIYRRRHAAPNTSGSARRPSSSRPDAPSLRAVCLSVYVTADFGSSSLHGALPLAPARGSRSSKTRRRCE